MAAIFTYGFPIAIEKFKEAGVTLTKAGSTFPYGVDPSDKNLRLAPTYPSDEELALAIHIVCICVKLSYFRKYMPDACK